MALINVTKHFHKHALDDKVFIGVVEDNLDPLTQQRLKVRVEEVFGNTITTAEMPWAIPFRESMFGAGSGLSGFAVPVIGTKVIVYFHRGNLYTPIYTAAPLTLEDVNTRYTTNYPNRYGFEDPNGTFTVTDTKDLTAKYSHISGNDVEILGLPNDPLIGAFTSPVSFTVPGDKGLVYLANKGVRLQLNPIGLSPVFVYSTIVSVTTGSDPTTVTIADPVADATLSLVDVTDSTIIVTHPTGSVAKFDAEGNAEITIHTLDDLPKKITLNGFDININATNNINLIAGVSINATATTSINLSGGGSTGVLASGSIAWVV